MREHHLAVPRSARYYTLGEPGPATREVWFVCHGYGQLAGRFLRHLEPLADATRLLVAPEALSRFYLESEGRRNGKIGASWMTREDRLSEIADYVRYLDALHDEVFRTLRRVAVSLHLLGFSQGTATCTRWAVLGAVRPDRLILWGGEVPPDLEFPAAAERLRPVRLLLVAGDQDEFITPKVLARDEALLREHGIPYAVRRFAGGHEIDAAVLRELAS
jgi:predicted esterase